MQKRFILLVRYFVLIFLSLLLAACGTSTTGAPPASATPSRGDGSVEANSTPTKNPAHLTPTVGTGSQDMPTPPASLGSAYTFVRAGQLWVAINGASPVQATHFDYSSAGPNPNIFFGQPLWFASDRFVAFTLKTLGAGLGGGGCGFSSNYGRSGELFVLDTTTMRLSQISVPGEQSSMGQGDPYNGYWEFLFTEDATHLLAWHNDVGLKGAGGLYRYDLNTQTLSLTIPSSSVPGADNQEAWSPMRYSSGQLYYETMTPPYGGNNTVYSIYSHSVSNPGMPGTKVLDVGSEPFCVSQGGNQPLSGPFTEPGWDVSQDGKYLAAQTIVTNGSTTVGSVKVVMLFAGTTLALFAEAPTQVLNHDASLSWSHDGQTVVLKSPISQGQQITLYSVTLSSPTAMQMYNTNGTVGSSDNHLVNMVWQGDGGVFALFGSQQFCLGSIANAYEFIVGQPNGTLLLANARNFTWG